VCLLLLLSPPALLHVRCPHTHTELQARSAPLPALPLRKAVKGVLHTSTFCIAPGAGSRKNRTEIRAGMGWRTDCGRGHPFCGAASAAGGGRGASRIS
jgi:hypothetical protein